MNKKADSGDYAMFFVFAFLMFIIAGGIAMGVFAFFGGSYGFNYAESGVLFLKVKECLNENDFFVENFDIYLDCGFNSNIDERHIIYVKRISDGKIFLKGVEDYINQCELVGGIGNENFPKCVNRNVFVKGEEFEILVGSNQDSKRVLTE